jgi:hypothetical protein
MSMTTRQTPDAVREAYMQGQVDMRERAAQVCDQRGAEEQEAFGLVRGTQNYFRARNAVRDLQIAALDSRAGDAGEGLVKTLCWTEPHPSHSYPNWTAGDVNIMFYARINTSEPLSYGKFPLSINGSMIAEKFDTVEAAKAYAQRNYAKRILSALSATPAPAVDAVPAGEGERLAIRNEIINTPETADFMAGVPLEAAHQRERWGADHDAGKRPLDWFWLIGFLAQKAADAAMRGDIKKAKHHTISTGAALANWHAALTGTDIKMRPGISAEAQAAAEGRGALSLALQTDALSHGEGR